MGASSGVGCPTARACCKVASTRALAGLPLLQRGCRTHVRRCFAAAARALAAAGSPLHRLRAQLHLELARCEVAGDNLVQVR